MNIIEINELGKCFHLSRRSRFPSLMDIGRKWFVRNNAAGGDEEIFWAFRDVTFKVTRGERVGIIGSNGSGKTTLLRVLARIIAPTVGMAELNGRVGSIIEIGSGFHPELTGRENTFLNGVIMGMNITNIKKKFDRIVSFSGIEKFIDTPVKYYSSGMYLRLAFSIAVHLDIDILLLDEVMAVGDEAFQRSCHDRLMELSTEGCTLLTVSHDLGMVKQFCTRAILMERGRIITESTNVEEVMKRYSVKT